jgi:GH15 family glucan-1,4-alpha-glucosidase
MKQVGISVDYDDSEHLTDISSRGLGTHSSITESQPDGSSGRRRRRGGGRTRRKRNAKAAIGPVNSGWKVLKRKQLLQEYKAISDYGMIGDQLTCALVGLDGSIDWLCLPAFDSPSVFGALLDRKKGGTFRIFPDYREFESMQNYDGLTSVLATEFRADSGRVKLIDFMPCSKANGKKVSTSEVHRRITCVEGRLDLKIIVEPRPGYGSDVPQVEVLKGAGYSFVPQHADNWQELAFIAPFRFDERGGSLTQVLSMREGAEVDLVLRYGGLESHHSRHTGTDIKLRETYAYWKRWARRSKYQGRWREMVLRSALTLKLLTYGPTGAILAAPTTSLPEEIHGIRNWDYRYSWIRDSSFVLWAFHSLGLDRPADRYLDWLISIFYLTSGELQVMLGINGERDLTEHILKNLEGYQRSPPVRVGNGAWNQFQLDVYGILLDALWFSHRHMGGISKKLYRHLLSPIVETVEEKWNKPDSGIWEVRGRKRHFVYSKMWCWVALDRAVKVAEELGMKDDSARWSRLRDEIRDSVMTKGWDKSLGSFVRSYGSKQLDAANLLMPQVRFIDAEDPKMRSTIERTMEVLMRRGKFVYRYLSDDGLPGEEGAFLSCSFWLVNCLTLLGRLDEAEKLLSSLMQCSNHLGLFSEEIDPESGAMLGNFPQAFTHMGFITAAVGLSKALEERSTGALRPRPGRAGVKAPGGDGRVRATAASKTNRRT